MAKAVKGKIDTPVETAVEPDDGKRDYVVCEKAPPRVAGRRVHAGDHLRLTETEALGELLALHIRPLAEGSEVAPDTTASNPV